MEFELELKMETKKTENILEPASEYKEPASEYKEPASEYKEPASEYKEPASEYKEPASEYKELACWEDLGAKTLLLRGIYTHGFEKPSPIQSKAIKPLFEKRDVIAQAQSGTGKTGCFVIASLQLIDINKNAPQVLLMAPTRELAIQTMQVVNALGSLFKGLQTQLLIGGTSTEEDGRKLAETPPQIVIGCPGRVHDMIKRNRLQTKDFAFLVMDEADEMLSSGFKEQVYNIFQLMPSNIQVALFSATMPFELNSLTAKFMRNPVKILVNAEKLSLEGINQYYVALDNDDQKYETLKDIYGSLTMSQCIIYCNSVKRVHDLYEAMQSDNFPVCQIHSNMEKEERTRSFQEFKSGKHRVLISSNVTARGLDVQQVSTIINFDIPNCVHTYLHRIGRSGRWGRKGVGINFMTSRDSRKIREIEEHYKMKIPELNENWATE
jgi:translation initiation factor 4A